MELAIWILAGLAALYLLVRLAFAVALRQQRYDETSDVDLPIDQPRP